MRTAVAARKTLRLRVEQDDWNFARRGVLLIVREMGHAFLLRGPDRGAFVARGHPCPGPDGGRAHLHRHVGVSDHIAEPLRVARLPSGRAEYRIAAPHRQVDERIDPFGACLGPGVVQQQQRLPLEEPPDLPAVGAKFRDDFSIEVVAIRHDRPLSDVRDFSNQDPMGRSARHRRQGPAEEAVQGERRAGRTRRVDRGVRGDEGVGLVVHDRGPGGGHLVAVRPVLRAQPGHRGVVAGLGQDADHPEPAAAGERQRERGVRGRGEALREADPAAPVLPGLPGGLGDSTLQLAFRRPEGPGFADTAGLAVDPAQPAPGRAVVPLTGAQEAVLVYDAGLDLEPHLVRLTAAAASMALEHSRLQAEVQAQLELVRASRARIVEAGDAERRRLERDLHDGAQQRLVTLTLALGMARSRVAGVDPELEALIEAAGKEAKEALTELRELARGIHPAVLTETGLAGAIPALVERSPAVVEITEVPRERFPAVIEATAYFVVSEALANVAKHA